MAPLVAVTPASYGAGMGVEQGPALVVAVLIGYGQSAYPVVTIEAVGGRGVHPEDRAAAVSVPMGVWADYVEARAALVAAEAAIVALDPARPAT
jgi:hypothetical protein